MGWGSERFPGWFRTSEIKNSVQKRVPHGARLTKGGGRQMLFGQYPLDRGGGGRGVKSYLGNAQLTEGGWRVWGRGGGQKLFGQWPFQHTPFQRGASLFFNKSFCSLGKILNCLKTLSKKSLIDSKAVIRNYNHDLEG